MGSALRAATAASQASALREVMKTLEHPAWSRLVGGVRYEKRYRDDGEMGIFYPDAAWSPRPREPPDTTATFPSREKMFLKSWSWTSASAIVKDMHGNGRTWSKVECKSENFVKRLSG